jgi:uncharacterized protein YggU (UPF0235/DUF167 family)
MWSATHSTMPLKITVTVKAQAKKESAVKTTNGDLVVSVHAPARDGQGQPCARCAIGRALLRC